MIVRHDRAHEQDLLNGVTAIQAAAEILSDNADLSVHDRRDFLLVILAETNRLQRLIAD